VEVVEVVVVVEVVLVVVEVVVEVVVVTHCPLEHWPGQSSVLAQ